MRRRALAAAALLAPVVFTSISSGDIAGLTVPLPHVGQAQDVAVQSDGKVVAAFHSDATYRFTVVRLLADGTTLDPTFGDDGIVETALEPTGFSVIYDIEVQPDGRIIAAGYTGTVFGQRNFGLVRYRADGTLDPTFGGGDGIAISDVAAHDATRLSMALTPNGSIIVGAATQVAGSLSCCCSPASATTARPTPHSVRTASWSLTFRIHCSRPTTSSPRRGRPCVVGGGTYDENGTGSQQFLARITPNGALDPTFGVGGLAMWVQGPGYAVVRSVEIAARRTHRRRRLHELRQERDDPRSCRPGSPTRRSARVGTSRRRSTGRRQGADRPGNDVAVLPTVASPCPGRCDPVSSHVVSQSSLPTACPIRASMATTAPCNCRSEIRR